MRRFYAAVGPESRVITHFKAAWWVFHPTADLRVIQHTLEHVARSAPAGLGTCKVAGQVALHGRCNRCYEVVEVGVGDGLDPHDVAGERQPDELGAS